MIEILKTENLKKYNSEIKDLKIQNPLVFEIKDKNSILGYGIFICNSDQAIIYYLSAEDELLYDGLIRSVLNYILLNGVDKAYLKIKDKTLCEKLGVVQKDNDCIHSIENFLFNCKNCKF